MSSTPTPSAQQDLEITVKDVSYKVTVPKKKGEPAQDKTILHHITTRIRPGRLTALMGPSGAGKTTFLHLLAGQLNGGTVTGDLRLNDQPINHKKLKSISGYVYQDDVLLETMTVREAITFSARMKLGHLPDEAKRDAVEDVIQKLRLTKAADVRIGGVTNKGISGGERKRVSVAMELVTNPPILFLDEPTSGLDTFTAFTLVHILRDLARAGHTIIATIHQPSSDIFNEFDDLFLLSSGRVVYSGEVVEAVPYFARQGFPCPQYSNPADFFFMHVLTVSTGIKDIEGTTKRAADSEGRALELAAAWAESHPPDSPVWEKHQGTVVAPSPAVPTQKEACNCGQQLKWLMARTVKDQLRNPLMLRGKLMQALAVHLVVGLLYFDLTHEQPGVQDRLGCIFFLLANMLFSTALGVVSTFAGERAVFQREHASDMYSLPAYFISKLVVELPGILLTPVIGISIAYYMVGFQPDEDKFFLMMLTSIAMTLTGNAVGLLFGCAFKDVAVAVQTLPMALMPMMLFSGFMVNDESIPVYLDWLKYLSPMKYAMNALIKSEFDGLELHCSIDEFVETSDGRLCPVTRGEQVITSYGIDDDIDIGPNVAVLIAMYVGFTALSFWSLRRLVASAHQVTYLPASASPSPTATPHLVTAPNTKLAQAPLPMPSAVPQPPTLYPAANPAVPMAPLTYQVQPVPNDTRGFQQAA